MSSDENDYGQKAEHHYFSILVIRLPTIIIKTVLKSPNTLAYYSKVKFIGYKYKFSFMLFYNSKK